MTTPVPTGYRARATLPLRLELIRQVRRRRTLVGYLLVIAVPIIVVTAVKFGPSSSGQGDRRFGGGSLDLVGLATAGAWNFTVTMIFFASGFLLVVIVAMFCGDTVASEASWSTLRYLLAAPVPRRRLLAVKLAAGLILSAGAIAVLILASYLIGLLAFGGGPLTTPNGGNFGDASALGRIAIIGGYLFISLLFTAGIAFLMSVITDVPLGAVGTAVVIVIVSSILDAIDALGSLRDWLPTNYGSAWINALSPQVDWTGMARGSALAIACFIVLVGYAVLRFDRKDVLS
jgi:ABC-2 type transport system permease protein